VSTGQHEAARPPFVLRARKFLVGAAGLVAMVVSSGALHGNPAETWLNAVLAVATAAGIYVVPNVHPES